MHSISEVFSSYAMVNVDLAENTLAHSDRAIRLFLTYLTEIGHSLSAADVSRDEANGRRAWMIMHPMQAGMPNGDSKQSMF